MFFVYIDGIDILDTILDYFLDRSHKNKRCWNQVKFALFSAAFQVVDWSRSWELWRLLPASELPFEFSFPSLEGSFQSPNPEVPFSP